MGGAVRFGWTQGYQTLAGSARSFLELDFQGEVVYPANPGFTGDGADILATLLAVSGLLSMCHERIKPTRGTSIAKYFTHRSSDLLVLSAITFC